MSESCFRYCVTTSYFFNSVKILFYLTVIYFTRINTECFITALKREDFSDDTKSLQYRDVIIKIDNGFIILLLLYGCQMEVFNIFSFSPDKIQFWQYTHIYCIGKLLIFFLMTNEMEFRIFATFYYPGHGYFTSIDGIIFHTKKTAYGDDLVFGIIRFKRRETIHTFAPRSERLMNDFPFYRRCFFRKVIC